MAADAKVCIACGRDIQGRPVALRPPDPKYALCSACASADTGHTQNHACGGCGHPWDQHMAVRGGCNLCACWAHPPNQPAAPAQEATDGR